MALLIAPAALSPAGSSQRFAVPCARAESAAELLKIEMTARPAELVEPGDVSLSFTISNPSDTDARNVYLSSSDGLLSEPIGRIAAGESQSFTRPHSVSLAELDAGEITYIVSHDDPDDEARKINYTVRAAIRQSDLQPAVEFTRQFSNRSVAPGDTVTITYRVRNTGNVALNSLRVQDSLGDFTGRADLLDVGESRTLISRVTLTEEAASAPTLTYAADGQNFTQTLSEAAIRMAYPRIDVQFSAGHSAFSGSTADVVLILTNLGNVDYRNVRITDDVYGGVIADELCIPRDSDPVEVSCSYPIRGDAGFRWRVTGISEAGSRINFVTETVNLAPREVSDLADVNLRATAATPRIRRAGTVPVRLRIENAGDADVTDVQLGEDTLGALRSFAIVPAGGAIDCEIPLEVTESGWYSFHVQYTDAEGWQNRADCPPVEVVIAPDGVLPEGAEPGFIEFTGNSIKIGGSSLFAVLMIAGCVVLAVLITILAVASRKARMEKRLRIAQQRLRRREEAGKSGKREKESKESK